MYQGSYEDQAENYEECPFGMLEKSQFCSVMGRQQDNVRLDSRFQEVFLANFAPNCSSLSVCALSDRTYETFSICDDFMGESVDYFLAEHPLDNYGESFGLHQAVTTTPTNLPQQPTYVQSATAVEVGQSQSKILQVEQQREEPANCHDETKNIPKNYIKAIFAFILESEKYVGRFFEERGAGREKQRFLQFVRGEKKIKKYTIERLKSLWTECEFGDAMRVFSCEFLRKRSLGYIFGSKIEKKLSHIKHRYKFIKSIEDPAGFTNIK